MFDAVTYGAAVGAAKKYTDEHSGSDDAVKYTEQSLTSEQQAQARENIGAAASTDIPTDAVKYTAQTLTDAQKAQARTNIGVGTDNKLRLGQIYANGSFGIGAIYSGSSINNIQFLTNEVTNDTGISSQYQFGDFVMYKENDVYYFAPIGGRTIGISMTGQWIHAENCYCMFYVPKYSSPTSLDVSALDTSKVKTMNSMFICEDLTSLDLSTFDTSNVQDMTRMFYKCTALTTLDLSSFDMTNVIAYDKMFGEKSHWAGITTLKTPKINPHDDIPLPRTLYSQDGTAYTNLPVTTGTSIELRQSWT